MQELRDRIIAHLRQHRVCVISTSGSVGAWAMPVWCRPVAGAFGGQPLDVECLLPRWADVIYHLEFDAEVLLIAFDVGPAGLRWLQYRGTARPITSPDWSQLLPAGTPAVRPEDRYVAIRITAERVDLIDESRGWGARETLDV